MVLEEWKEVLGNSATVCTIGRIFGVLHELFIFILND